MRIRQELNAPVEITNDIRVKFAIGSLRKHFVESECNHPIIEWKPCKQWMSIEPSFIIRAISPASLLPVWIEPIEKPARR
jgi:hypothetical protein